MIKRKKVGEYSGYLAGCAIVILIGIGMFCFLSYSPSFNELEEGLRPIEFEIIIMAIYLFAIGIASGGVVCLIDVIDYSKHPERYNYCKRCKHIISKKKGIFCYSCTDSIETSLERNNEKYFATYKKNYKDRYKKLKARVKKK